MSEQFKLVATEFFRWWHNQPGANTDDGFDEWWEINQARFAPAARSRVPEGWRLVPVEPTPEMIEAGMARYAHLHTGIPEFVEQTKKRNRAYFKYDYTAMVAAAPEAQQHTDPVEIDRSEWREVTIAIKVPHKRDSDERSDIAFVFDYIDCVPNMADEEYRIVDQAKAQQGEAEPVAAVASLRHGSAGARIIVNGIEIPDFGIGCVYDAQKQVIVDKINAAHAKTTPFPTTDELRAMFEDWFFVDDFRKLRIDEAVWKGWQACARAIKELRSKQ